jgi:hypothetical protein
MVLAYAKQPKFKFSLRRSMCIFSWIRGPHIFVFKSPIKNIFPTSLYTNQISWKSSILYRNNSKVYVMLNRASI